MIKCYVGQVCIGKHENVDACLGLVFSRVEGTEDISGHLENAYKSYTNDSVGKGRHGS